MNPQQSTIPTETLTGCVVKQLWNGQPFLVFVEDQQTPGKPRCVSLVVETETGYAAFGHRASYESLPGMNPLHIASEYLSQFPPL